MKITYYGHACFGMEVKGKHLIFDPFISPNELAKSIDIQSIPADYILLSHAHGDHVADVETIVQNTGASLISNAEIITYYSQKGIEGHMMNHGGKWKFDFGIVKYTTAIHSSSFPDGSNGGNPGGFVIWNDANCFYYAGDTALTMDMKLIPMTCPRLDFAILPLGDNFTMGYEDAVIASDFIECEKIIACHFDTFGYIRIDHEEAKKAFAKRGKELILPGIGQSIEV
ncbi:MAG TPA: metal-dependent hydrolase [Saprospiraceae bacterium]|nr:metal-dependent hydrolase [Saprospiraceae bacterium]HMP23932.1 metal-dependent hydrolase [Saprospiraceae bacterium]